VYNQYSEPTQFTDQLGNVRTVQYDSNFFPKLITDTIDGATAVLEGFQYNSDGTKQADAPGYDLPLAPNKATQYTYDSNGNLASVTDPLGRITQYKYDSAGHLLSVTSPGGGKTSYQYDALGHVIEMGAGHGWKV
jgi:YD repeat-containing protein